jgi:hypothetical protein
LDQQNIALAAMKERAEKAEADTKLARDALLESKKQLEVVEKERETLNVKLSEAGERIKGNEDEEAGRRDKRKKAEDQQAAQFSQGVQAIGGVRAAGGSAKDQADTYLKEFGS